MPVQPPLVTVHLHRVPLRGVPAALVRMAVDRVHLARTPGLAFAKSLGCGDGRTFGTRDADPRTWGLLAVWDSPGDLVRFEASSPVARAWAGISEETWRADLVCLRSHGAWSGQAPFGGGTGGRSDGPVVAITRARLTPGRWRTFWRAVPPVAADLKGDPGLVFRIGIGEAPIGLQGTFSIWRSEEALIDFAYRRGPHREAIRRTGEVGWYSEELFARFAILGTTGTLGGRDPAAT